MDGKSAGIECKLKIVIYVFTEQGTAGDARGRSVSISPLRVVASATAPCVALPPASMQSTPTPSRESNSSL